MARGRATNYDEQRATILAAAARLFAQRGFPATSMNQVAEATGLSKATLYHYFRDKYAILLDIAEGHVQALESLVADVAQQGLAPDVHVRTLIERILHAYAGARDAHTVLTSDVRFLEPADRRRVLDRERRVVAGFADAIGRWRPEQARAEMTTPLTMLLFGMINWMFTWLRPGGPHTYESMAPIVADLFAGGVPAVRAPAPVGRTVAARPKRKPGA